MKGRIFQIMQSKQLTQRDFAAILGISPSSLSSIFNGHTSPTNNTVQAIHRRFPEISIAWLMFGEGEMTVSSAAQTSPANSDAEVNGEGVRPSSPQENQVAPSADSAPLLESFKNGQNPQPVIIRETVKYIDKPQRKITEIRVFYDDGTYDTFSGSRE